MIELRLFAAARETAGRARDTFDAGTGATLGSLLDEARARYGGEFAAVLETARVWLNGDEPPEGLQSRLAAGDEVAVLPPVSGG